MIFDLFLSDEQRLLVESLQTFLSDALPVERLRHPTGFGAQQERNLWSQLAGLGLFGFAIPEVNGGVGYGLPEEVLASQALGRYCVSSTVLATMLAAHIAKSLNEIELCRALCVGQARACFANPLEGGEVQLIDAEACDWVVLLAQSTSLIARADVENWRQVRSFDEGIAMERGKPKAGCQFTPPWGERASLLIAAFLVGNSQATVDMAVSYVSNREQFGQAIGAFQAIKFGCADMAVRAAAAEAQTFYAAMVGADDDVESTAQIASARWLARTAAIDNAKANIQFHGAMGFTAECDAHLYLKRALLFASLGSDQRKEECQLLAPML